MICEYWILGDAKFGLELDWSSPALKGARSMLGVLIMRHVVGFLVVGVSL